MPCNEGSYFEHIQERGHNWRASLTSGQQSAEASCEAAKDETWTKDIVHSEYISPYSSFPMVLYFYVGPWSPKITLFKSS